MHREPTPKSQAKIVRRVFADHGVDLAHRQALDVVAQLHGHNSWQVMQAAAEAPAVIASKVASAPMGEVYSIEPATQQPAPLSPKVMTFESMGFVEDRTSFKQLVEDTQAAERIWNSLEDQLAMFGLSALDSVYITEDDGQDDDDIKVFIGIKVIGKCSWHENEQASRELASLFDAVAAAVCFDRNGRELVRPDDWELLYVDDLK